MTVRAMTVPGVMEARRARIKLKDVIKVRDSPDKLVEVSNGAKVRPSLEPSTLTDIAVGVPVNTVCHVS
jgi:hypothetical protein